MRVFSDLLPLNFVQDFLFSRSFFRRQPLINARIGSLPFAIAYIQTYALKRLSLTGRFSASRIFAQLSGVTRRTLRLYRLNMPSVYQCDVRCGIQYRFRILAKVSARELTPLLLLRCRLRIPLVYAVL